MKIHPVGSELFHVDGRTDVTKLIVALRNFADVHKTGLSTANVFKSASFPETTDVPRHYFTRLETKP